MEIEFSVYQRGTTAHLLAYNKLFKGKRFSMSTGVTVKNLNPTRPGKLLKQRIKDAETAFKDMANEGRRIDNESLKNRINLMLDGYQWNGSELSIWTGKEEVFEIEHNDPFEKSLQAELRKQKPDLKKIVSTHLSQGKNELFGFWEGVLDGTFLPKEKKLRASTISTKRQVMNIVKLYNSSLTFADMNQRFYNEFVNWLSTPYEVKEKSPRKAEVYDSNSVGKFIKEIKSILHLARANEYEVSDNFTYWHVIQEKNEVVTLSKSDLQKIMDLKLKGTEQDVRDIFVMACFIGPRIDDFESITNPDNFTILDSGQMMFNAVYGKTGIEVDVPIMPQLREFIKNRKPKMISAQNFREHLRKICQKAELNDRVTIKIRDGKPLYAKKWEAISPHSARRTFATSLFYGWWTKPLPSAYIMPYTGHKSEKSFMLYIGASKKDIASKALEILDLKPYMEVS